MPLLEIAANSISSALAAQEGGADRIELCCSLDEGGLTPSFGVIATVRDRLRIPIHVLIRPRPGDFLYDEADCEAMIRDIQACVRLGCEGVVIGALDPDGNIDRTVCRPLIEAAGPLEITFHRAIDAARNPEDALEQVAALGCHRVLTSGACRSAATGADAIARLVARAGDRIDIMAGGGITPENLVPLARATGARHFHASAKTVHRSDMRWRNEALAGLDPDHVRTSVLAVRELVAALRSV
ncbi:copper homeostasis protein CutC [Tahibacter amnicola]|uniref:PF03932 family protein CutC n=1 Tax=Tahibacter amnicola TaxID=2976241 RepID=A0ABY6BKX5_9GAMM|nr:copper homeostasis protein CutC [Tahibacter amnicola]UXI70427.1 copper homeostasis protein CutC [Tahibacter amnicola]